MNDRQKEVIAWALATEGSFSLNRGTGRSYVPRISFINTDVGLVSKFNAIVQCGKIYPRNRGGRNKPLWEWILGGVRGCLGDFLEGIIPFLPAKKERAYLLLEFCRLRQATSRKGIAWRLGQSNRLPREDEIYLELKRLNRRGIIDA